MNTTRAKFFKRHHNESGKARQKLNHVYIINKKTTGLVLLILTGGKMSKTDKRARYKRGGLSDR